MKPHIVKMDGLWWCGLPGERAWSGYSIVRAWNRWCLEYGFWK